MGEAAEMLLDGTCCEGCGEFLDGESTGYPRYCTACGGDNEEDNSAYEDDDTYEDFLAFTKERDEKVLTIKAALKEYSGFAFKLKCGKSCQKTNRGIKHTSNCRANRHKKLAREACKIYKEYME